MLNARNYELFFFQKLLFVITFCKNVIVKQTKLLLFANFVKKITKSKIQIRPNFLFRNFLQPKFFRKKNLLPISISQK